MSKYLRCCQYQVCRRNDQFFGRHKLYKLAGIEAPSLSLVKIKSSVIGQKRSILKWGEKENAFYSEKGNISIEE